MTFCSRLVVTLGLLGASSRTKPGGFIPVEPVTVNGTASPDSYSLRPDSAPTGSGNGYRSGQAAWRRKVGWDWVADHIEGGPQPPTGSPTLDCSGRR